MSVAPGDANEEYQAFHEQVKQHAIAQVENALAQTDPIGACVTMLANIHDEDHESHILQSLLVESIGAKGVGKVKARREVAAKGGLDLLVKLLLKWQQRNVDTGGSDETSLLLETKCVWALANVCPNCEKRFAAAEGGRGFEALVSALRSAHKEDTPDSVSQALVMQVMRILANLLDAGGAQKYKASIAECGGVDALTLVLGRFVNDGMVQWRGQELLKKLS